jgi:hypothetical protein
MHFLAAFWDSISAAPIGNCFRKAVFLEVKNKEKEAGNQMEGTNKGA